MKQFDFYEFTGVLVPGAVVLLGVGAVYPQLRTAWPNLTVGDLGFFAILAYIAGHLTQAIGNELERGWWRLWGGMPSDWLRSRKRPLLAPDQLEVLPSALNAQLGLPAPVDIGSLTSAAWFAITRQVYAAIAAARRSDRADVFNGNYGMFRGLATGLLVVAAVVVARHALAQWGVLIGLVIATALATSRMQRFAKYYASEVFVQFLQLSAERAKNIPDVARTPAEGEL